MTRSRCGLAQRKAQKDLLLAGLDTQDLGASTSACTVRCHDQPLRYLCYFRHRLLDFRAAEIKALAAMVGCDASQVHLQLPYGGHEALPFWYLTLPSELAAIRIADRAVLLRVRIPPAAGSFMHLPFCDDCVLQHAV